MTRLLSMFVPFAVALFVLCGFGMEASAQAETPAEPSPENMREARYRFDQGQLSYNSAHFADAAEHFEAAHRLSGLDEMYYNIFLAHRDGANLAGAVVALARYLESGASAEMAPQRERLEGTLAAMRATLAQSEGRETQTETSSSAGETSEAETAEASPGPRLDTHQTLDEDSSGASAHTIAGASLLGVAAAGVVLGIVMQVKRNGEATRLDDECQLGPSANRCPASLDQQSIADDHSRFGTIRWVGFGIATAALAGGLTLLLMPKSSDSDRAQIDVSADPSGVRVGLHGAF